MKKWQNFDDLSGEEFNTTNINIVLSPAATIGRIQQSIEQLAYFHPRLKQDRDFRRLIGAVRHAWRLMEEGVVDGGVIDRFG